MLTCDAWYGVAQLERPMPWDVLSCEPAIHLLLFVHRVDGLTPGLYVLVRDREVAVPPAIDESGIGLDSGPRVSGRLPLYWLLEGDARSSQPK